MLESIKKLVFKTRSKKSKNLGLNLGRIEIKENQVKSDFQIIDKYQSFSAEILRLALIGIGAYAYLLKDSNSIFRTDSITPAIKVLSIISIVSFALAVVSTLIHRYYSSDFMAYHIRYLRLKEYEENPLEEQTPEIMCKVKTEAETEAEDRNDILQLCEVMIASSAIFLGLGTICLAISLLTVLL